MELKEIRFEDLDAQSFIEEQCRAISSEVGDSIAINALSGGVDSSVVSMLGHRALGDRLKTYFIDNGIMRAGEPEYVVSIIEKCGVPVELVDARDEFFDALKGKTDPEEKRQAITDTFYKSVFGRLVKESGSRFLLQGTNFTDVEETVAGIKRQHNILAQLGIDTEDAYGYRVIEPIIQLRKPAVRALGKALGLPAVSEVVGRYNGAIKVESGPGAGTLFRVLFPVSQQETADEKVEPEEKPDGVVECSLDHKGSVLLVDDEQFILSMVKDMLELINFKVITAQDGQQAIDLFQEHKNEITCILLDLNMPGKNGKETFEELQQIKAEVPVIITSGSTEAEVREQFGGTVPSEFLQKPYHYSTLVGKVSQLLSANQN